MIALDLIYWLYTVMHTDTTTNIRHQFCPLLDKARITKLCSKIVEQKFIFRME